MSDPNVDSCQYRLLSDSGKWRCMFKGRKYYHCVANREECCCPLGLTTTYDDPEPKKYQSKHYGLKDNIISFHESRNTNRWNLKNRMDAYQLYHQLDLLQFRYLELWLTLLRSGHYKEAHQAWGKHKAYEAVLSDLFPYKDDSTHRGLSDDYTKAQRRLMELEEDHS